MAKMLGPRCVPPSYKIVAGPLPDMVTEQLSEEMSGDLKGCDNARLVQDEPDIATSLQVNDRS